MKPKAQQQITVALIKDLLIFTKLTNGLAKIGWEADEYSLNLASTIFTLMGFKDDPQTEKVFEDFLNGLDRVENINIKQHRHLLDQQAEVIYLELKNSKLQLREQELINKLIEKHLRNKKRKN